MSLLDICGLTHSYGEHPLYENASLSLYKGEHLGIVGPNGAGKSTLIKICTGEVLPASGSVRWQPGISAGHLDQHARIDDDITIDEFLKSAFRSLYLMEHRITRSASLLRTRFPPQRSAPPAGTRSIFSP